MLIALEPLKKIPGETLHYELSADAEKLELTDDDVSTLEPLTVSFTAVYRDGKYFLTGSLRTRVALTCSRCLKPFTFSLVGETDDEIPAEDQKELDLTELVREMYYTSLPLKPLCDEDCRGLCADCGGNLNEKQCDCHVYKMDHRLSVLKKLLEE